MFFLRKCLSSVHFSHSTCQTLCDTMDCSTRASLSINNSRNLLRLMTIKSVMPSKQKAPQGNGCLLRHSPRGLGRAWLLAGHQQWLKERWVTHTYICACLSVFMWTVQNVGNRLTRASLLKYLCFLCFVYFKIFKHWLFTSWPVQWTLLLLLQTVFSKWQSRNWTQASGSRFGALTSLPHSRMF